jgi:ferredoxin-NADP reductase/DMSO/TMAO reductase YedYZ heme-binding membrane subunit
VGVFWVLLLWVTALWVVNGGVQELGSVAGALTTLGRLTGLIASALLLVQVFLMARVPWFEQAWGQDGLARTHRLVGFTSFSLLWAHIVLITLGYAAGTPVGLWGTIVDFVLNYPGMLLAVAGTVALCMVVVTSLKLARRRLRYESWHLIHLYGYLGAGLALPHQLWTGQDFLASHASTVTWWTLYAASAGAVLWFRVGVPLVRSARADLRVVSVRSEGGGITSVLVGGPGVARLAVRPGQFFQWRFLDGTGWTRANPYSLSAAPDGRHLRITAADVGDGSARLATLRPGTRVLVEGPYGRLHAGVRTRSKVLLLGAGIGITPLRSILEGLDQQTRDVVVVHRARDAGQLVLQGELSDLAARRGGRYVTVTGPRLRGRQETWLPAAAAPLTDAQALAQLVPDVAERDVFLCGAPAWMDAAKQAALDCGVPADQIHLERFEY